MKKLLTGIVLFLYCILLHGQFQDDFNDSSFPTDPDWFGNTNIYVVNASNELQLMDVDAGESLIYSIVPTADSTTWEFFFRLEFNPSADNNLKVYLNSNSPDFDADLNGYYLQLGESGGDDAIELRRQDGGSTSVVLSGTTGAIALEPAVRIRITRDQNADWFLYADYSGGTNFQLEGTANDPTYNEGTYFGFKCEYGVTRRDKFFFDDITIGPVVQDETPPELISAMALNANSVMLQFSEPLEQSSAETLNSYNINNGININDVTLDSDPSMVLLNVSALSSGQSYTATAENILDLNGNELIQEQASFIYYLVEPVEPFDILINELMPDPDTEQTNLPDAEYIELFNQSDKAISLEGFEIFDASNNTVLPEFILAPQSYLIICNSEHVNDLMSFGSVLGVSSLVSLNNTGDEIGLRDNNGVLIHDIVYTSSTWQDDDKNDGGWSIELINPTLYCQGALNWRASVDSEGGTPGSINSVNDDTPDQTPPQLLDAIAISNNQLRLYYNEIMGASATDINNYTITGAGNVLLTELDVNQQSVLLTIEAPLFMDGQNYTVDVNSDVSDCSGNSIGLQSFNFTFLQTEPAERYDILINEIYPNPSPSFGLPEKEFIELYNRSEKAINLQDFILDKGSESVDLPFFLLKPDEYVILYEEGGLGFGQLGDTIAFDNFIGLSNDGDAIALINPEGEIIHSIIYNNSFYQDPDKINGGWSLELINPFTPCLFADNWRASVDPVGGTPGKQNSVLSDLPDETPMDLIRAITESDNEVLLIFNKALDEQAAINISNYSVDGLTLESGFLIEPDFNIVRLRFTENFSPGQIYEIEAENEVTDCLGNPIGMFNSARFAVPEVIEPGDIILNEVLYDPETGGHRFVELYNRSEKVFNIGDLNIADRDEEGQEIDNNIEVIQEYLLFPGEYVVLSPFPSDIKERYFVENKYQLLFNPLPVYASDEDAVVLFVPAILGPEIIDELRYDKTFHNALLDDKEGVSLERISFERTTQDPSNWQSAASTAGFATPTYLNSQQYLEEGLGDDIFELPYTTFSPDGDGFEDFLLINYSTQQSGWVANIQCFDANGRLVKRLVQNQSLASEGVFKWEGDTANGSKARIGIYIIWIELFDSAGNVQHFKKTCVVAGRLN